MEVRAVISINDPDSLSSEHKWNEIRAMNLTNQKLNMRVKVRLYTNGTPRRKCVPCEEAILLTTFLHVIVVSTTIGVYKGRNVDMFDVLGACRRAGHPMIDFSP